MNNNDSTIPPNKHPDKSLWEKSSIKGYLNNSKTDTHAEYLRKKKDLEAISKLVEDLGDVLIRLIQHMKEKLDD